MLGVCSGMCGVVLALALRHWIGVSVSLLLLSLRVLLRVLSWLRLLLMSLLCVLLACS